MLLLTVGAPIERTVDVAPVGQRSSASAPSFSSLRIELDVIFQEPISPAVAYMEPFFNKNDDPNSGKTIATARKVPVGYIHMKPVQQMVRKKNHTSLSIDQRDPRTGQVSGDDRTVQFSIDENYGLMAHNAKSLLKEFMSVRADDMVMKQEAYSDIRKNGYVSMADLTDDVNNKTALNTFNVYLLAMHMKSDLVDEGYMLNRNLERNEREE